MRTPTDQPTYAWACGVGIPLKIMSEANPKAHSWHRFIVTLLCVNIFVRCIRREICRCMFFQSRPEAPMNEQDGAIPFPNSHTRVLSYRSSEHYSTLAGSP